QSAEPQAQLLSPPLRSQPQTLSALRPSAGEHHQAQARLQGCRRVIEKNRFGHWAQLKAAFNASDKVAIGSSLTLGETSSA
ncbi:MAG: hypothetical protein EB006_11580, partial [Betaproteobacteria bacterium]|nr:hypothetical protein [Betaproteobacteria bacterium]